MDRMSRQAKMFRMRQTAAGLQQMVHEMVSLGSEGELEWDVDTEWLEKWLPSFDRMIQDVQLLKIK